MNRSLVCLTLLVALLSAEGYEHQHSHAAYKQRHANDEPNPHSHSTYKQRHHDSKRSIEAVSIGSGESLQPKRQYNFEYNAQLSSGYAPWISTQSSMLRLRSHIAIRFQSPTHAVLQMQECQLGQLNEDLAVQGNGGDAGWNPTRMQPIQRFDSIMKSSFGKALELPVEFHYTNGVVSRIRFHADDQSEYSKNVKKGVLNMLQLNLKPVNGNAPQASDIAEMGKQGSLNHFSTIETTIEGECDTVYTIIPTDPESPSYAISKGQQEWNVTKSINFAKCLKLADVAYGFQVDHTSFPYNALRDQTKQNGRMGQVLPKKTIDRSTTVQYVIRTPQGEGNPIIKKVELLSEYVLKGMDSESSQAMQTIVVAKLEYQGHVNDVDVNSSNSNKQSTNRKQEEETLMYNAKNEQEDKAFFMFGDEKFNRNSSPFQWLNGKPEKIQQLLGKIVEEHQLNGDWEGEGLEGIRIVDEMEQLVETIRQCTTMELKKAQELITQQQSNKPQRQTTDLFLNGLAMAGTRNTIAMLTSEIEKQQVGGEQRASQLLLIIASGAGLVAPSDRQADLLLKLCKSSTCQKSATLKQSCWLTFGALVGELNLQSKKANEVMGVTENPTAHDEKCPQSKCDLYKQVLLEQLSNSQSIYDQTVALKAIGNAAIEQIFEEPAIKQIMQGSSPNKQASTNTRQQQTLAIQRLHLIDAIRRVVPTISTPAKMQRLQQTLMPIFQNPKETPEVRIIALSALMKMRPWASLIDQIAFTVSQEQCPNVKSYAMSALKIAANSPFPQHRKISQHLKNVYNQLVTQQNDACEAPGCPLLSKTWQLPLFCPKQQEGIFVNLMSQSPVHSSFDHGKNNGFLLPSHISVGFDTFFNGRLQRDALKLAVCQKGLDKLMEELFEQRGHAAGVARSEDKQQQQQEGGLFSHASQQLQSIFEKLKIKGRKSNDTSTNHAAGGGAFAVFSLRVNDVDLVIIPVGIGGKQGNGEGLKSMFMQSIGRYFTSSTDGQQHSTLFQFPLNNKAGRLPTSVGWPMRISQQMEVVGKVKAERRNTDQSKLASLRIHPDLNLLQSQKMEICLMSAKQCVGVKSHRAFELNLPLEVEAGIQTTGEEEKQFKLSVKLPEKTVRLLGVHSIPSTYITTAAKNTSSSGMIKTIQNNQLKSQEREVNVRYGGVEYPIKIEGQYHAPRQLTNLKEISKVLMASENNVHLYFAPTAGQTPNKLQLIITPSMFRPSATEPAVTMRPRVPDFLANFQSKIFRPQQGPFSADEEIIDEEESNNDQSQSNSNNVVPVSFPRQSQKTIQSYLDKVMQQKSYRHSMKAVLQAEGGSGKYKAECQLEAVCDSKFQTCQSRLMVQKVQGQKWKLDSKLFTVMPGSVHAADLDMSADSQQQHIFMGQLEAEWGPTGAEQSIKVNLKGEPSTEMITMSMDQQRQQSRSSRKTVPFVNKYQMVMDYKLKPKTVFAFRQGLELLKANQLMNTQVKLFLPKLTATPTIEQGQLQSWMVIDPITQRHANLTFQGPYQRLQIQSMELPVKLQPMPLVQQFTKRGVHSVKELLFPRYSIIQSHSVDHAMRGRKDQRNGEDREAECRVKSGGAIETFDGMTYDAPMSSCYSVLVKDCSRGRFAVLAKRIQSASGDDNEEEQDQSKKLKIIGRHQQVIEIESTTITLTTSNGDEVASKRLRVKVDGQQFTSTDQQQSELPQNIQFQRDSQGRESVAVEIENGKVLVKFDGKSARIQLSPEYKGSQCGLCGEWDGKRGEEEFRMSNGETAGDFSSFHRSYSVVGVDEVDNSEECNAEKQGAFYQKMDKKQGWNQQRTQQDEQPSQQSQLPVEQTMMIETNHKVCFSLRPIKQCAQGWYPSTSVNDDMDGALLKRQQLQFSCLDRESIETRRLKKQVQRGKVIDMSDYSSSFVEQVVVPESCIQFN